MNVLSRFKETLVRLLTSAKVLTALVGLIVGAAAKRGIVLAPDDVNTVIAIFAVLIGAQGAADFGKGAAIVAAVNPPPPAQTQTVNVEAQQPPEAAPDFSRSPPKFS